MKTTIILEAGHLGLPASDLLNPGELKLIGMGNSDPDTWNVFKNTETGELKDTIEGLPVMPIDLAVSLQPDLIVIAADTPQKSDALKYMAIRAGFQNDILFLGELSRELTIRGAALRRLTRRLDTLGLPGNVAELGCGTGDISWQLNALMPMRKLFLFQTMENFGEKEEARLLSRMSEPGQVTLKRGWSAETAGDIEEEQFALVYMDVPRYETVYSGIEFFFPRMSRGGVLILCGYEDPSREEAARAVCDLEEKYGAFLILPLGDLKGTAMLVRP